MGVKFEFDADFQFGILAFVLKDHRDGDKAIDLINPDFFDDVEHSLIFKAIHVFRRKFGRIPDKTLLNEQLRGMFLERGYEDVVDSQKDNITKLIEVLFQRTVIHGDIILEKIARFASFVKMKTTLENVELRDYNSYQSFSERVSQALDVAIIKRPEDSSESLLSSVEKRILRRTLETSVIPTPFEEINKLTNAGGYSKGSIIVILDKPKNLKTAFLINWAKGCLKLKRNVLYIDMENGKEEILTRFDQSISGLTKREILSGSGDKKLLEMAKRYQRLGGELIVRRIPSNSTVTAIQREIDDAYREHGIRITDLFIDFLGLMGSLSRKSEDKDRISDAYLDVANLALRNGLYHVITAHHITRDGEKREFTRYKDGDIAKCIDIIRHAQVILGLNRTPEEREAEILRAEIIAQRDGIPHGRGLFVTDIPRQIIKPMTTEQLTQYQNIISQVEIHEEHGDI